MTIAAIGYLRIAATDTDAWMAFGTGVLGLMDAAREDAAGARFLRMDNHPFRFMIEPASKDGLIAAGLECRGRSEWLAVCERLGSAGHTLQAGPADEAARRCVTEYVTVEDPCGNTSSSTMVVAWTMRR